MKREELIEALAAQLELMNSVETYTHVYALPGIEFKKVSNQWTEVDGNHVYSEVNRVKLAYRYWVGKELKRQYTQWPELAYMWVPHILSDDGAGDEVHLVTPKGEATYVFIKHGIWGCVSKKGKIK